VTAVDTCGGSSITLTGLVSNNPEWVPGTPDPSILGAEIGTADFNFQLEAEREDPCEERTYTIAYQAVDGQGNVAQAQIVSIVPAE